MEFDFKNICIGKCIKSRADELDISMVRICNFLHTTEEEVHKMYTQENMDTELILKWCKLLEYDFFRIYTQHLIIFAPPCNDQYNKASCKQTSVLPQFRKNIYTKELISFILEMINTGQKTKLQIIEEYRIPKTTLYKWLSKHEHI
ncbi:transposase [Chryseobacterium sp. P1-3]|uniref:transposase n=1 Tax=Chryseobacterium sp. (strain P1-3) TaxID=1517683 RepID=UPI0004E792A9|nr:transposase [Chryseobacterium sp. P1-3]KFF75106.1 transposase [Chryseobacterium sp. P1-3]